jgi:UDP-glucose:(heptosyl)LPS alpha-1,3-glucosyltransferase
MKIGLVIEQFDPRRGGAEQWTFQFAERLLARGHEVHVVAQGFGPAARRLPIEAHPLRPISSRLHRAAAAERQLRRLAVDVIHDVGMGWHFDVFHSQDGSRLAQWEQRLLCLPRWLRPVKRGMMRFLPRYREFRKLLARQFADPQRVMLAVSQMVARDYQRLHGIAPEQTRVVYNGVDVQRFSPARRGEYRQAVRRRLSIGDDEIVALFVGHDFRRKGLATAIRAVGRLAREDHPVRLVVVGGKAAWRYLALALWCGAGGHVTFVGTAEDPVPFYAAADVHVLPTFYDPCSLAVLEAAASCLPSITTGHNGASELITEGVDGHVLSDPADDQRLAARLRALLDPSLRCRMGEAARRMALEHTLDRSCDEIVGVYQSLARARRTAA